MSADTGPVWLETKMATERDGNCPICQDSWKYVASALPCHHRFCLGCILRWTHRNPSCPLCRTPIETVRFSEQDEWDYVQLVITSPAESQEPHSPAGRTPDHLDENSRQGPEVSPPSSPQGTLSPDEQEPEPVGGLLPEVWAGLFQQNQFLLEPVRPWLCERLEKICRGRWWLVEAIESCILRYLCICGLNAEALAQRLLVFLEGCTAPLVQGLIEVVATRCSEKAQRLLHSHTAEEEDNSQAESSSSSRSKSGSFSSSSSQQSTPTNGSRVEEEAGTSEITHCGIPSHPAAVPRPAEWDQPQQAPEQPEQPAVAGPSAQGSTCSPSAPSQGRGCLPGVTRSAQKRKAPRPLDSPQPSKRP